VLIRKVDFSLFDSQGPFLLEKERSGLESDPFFTPSCPQLFFPRKGIMGNHQCHALATGCGRRQEHKDCKEQQERPDQQDLRENRVLRELLEHKGLPEKLDLLELRENKVPKEHKENRDQLVNKALPAKLVLLELMVLPDLPGLRDLLDLKDLPDLREKMVTMVLEAHKDLRVIKESLEREACPVRWVPRDLRASEASVDVGSPENKGNRVLPELHPLWRLSVRPSLLLTIT